MKLALIWAMSNNRTIGRNNALPWHLPEDMKYFKRVTMGKPIIMGRKTWESIGRPLPGRTNIVITRDRSLHADGIKIVHTLDEAIALAKSIAVIDGAAEAVVIGGAEIYAISLPKADRLYVTQVHANVEGDAHFPDFNLTEWRQLSQEDHGPSEENPYPYSFIILER